VTTSAAELVVYTTRTCGQCWALKAWLRTRRVAFREIVRKAAGGYMSVPTLLLPDGRVLVEPSHGEVAAALAT
jgi:mycoredoxin